MVIQETEQGRLGSNLETIPSLNLRYYLTGVEERMQKHPKWPIGSNFVAPLFSRAFGLDRWDVNRIMQAVSKKGVIDFIKVETGEGRTSYFLSQEQLLAFGAICEVARKESEVRT